MVCRLDWSEFGASLEASMGAMRGAKKIASILARGCLGLALASCTPPTSTGSAPDAEQKNSKSVLQSAGGGDQDSSDENTLAALLKAGDWLRGEVRERWTRPLFEKVKVRNSMAFRPEDIEALKGIFSKQALSDDSPDGHWHRPCLAVLTFDKSRVEGETLLISAEAELFWKGSDDPFVVERLLAESEIPKGDEDRLRAAFARAAVDLGKGVRIKDGMRRMKSESLLDVANGDDAHEAIWALRLLARREAKVGKKIAVLLNSPNRDIRSAALQALVAIKDPETVAELAGTVHLQDFEQLRIIIEAVTAIGGDEAMSFLEYLEAGHTDVDIRALAKEGQERIKRKRNAP